MSKLHEDLRKLLGSDRLLIFHQSICQHLYIPLTNYMEKLGLKSIFVSWILLHDSKIIVDHKVCQLSYQRIWHQSDQDQQGVCKHLLAKILLFLKNVKIYHLKPSLQFKRRHLKNLCQLLNQNKKLIRL